MIRIRPLCALLLAAPALLLAAPARAAEHGAEAKSEGAGGKPGTNVDMPYLMAPLTNADGKLTGYAYIVLRITTTSEGYVTVVREKVPFIQDAFVRNVNGSGVTTADDPEKVDIPAVETRLLADVRRVMGPGKVKALTICTVQVAELRPRKTPALHTLPEAQLAAGEQPKNPIKSRCT
jgi:hypothetical protein